MKPEPMPWVGMPLLPGGMGGVGKCLKNGASGLLSSSRSGAPRLRQATVGWVFPVTLTFTTAAAFCSTRALKSGTVISTRAGGVTSSASAGDRVQATKAVPPVASATATASFLILLGNCIVFTSRAIKIIHSILGSDTFRSHIARHCPRQYLRQP